VERAVGGGRHLCAGACIGLGIAGAIAVGINTQTTDRAASVAFALVAGLAAAGLVLAGRWLTGLLRSRVGVASL